MSISDLIKSKSVSDQARVESLRAERGNMSDLRDAALEEITTRPELYQKFLDLQADNISCSAGNVALTMFQMDGATKIGTISFWHEQGRYVREESMKDGAKVFVPARNSQRRGYLMGDYYDVSQTTGKPMKEPVPLAENTARMESALGALMNYSPVPITEGQELGAPARYDERNLCIAIDPSYGEAEVFSALATEIGYARGHDKGRNMDFDRRDYQLDAESIGYMLCRRFGVDCKPPQTGEVARLYEGYEPTDRGEALEALRKAARNMGDGIERSIQPRQQERGRRHQGIR